MKLPNRPLYNDELEKYAKTLKIPHFKGVFMRDSMPKSVKIKESAIINLDNSKNSGTHWVAYIKNGNTVQYFDSFGNLKPPRELVKYFDQGVKIIYNNDSYQTFNQINCGHLCLQFLYNNK